MVLPRHPKTRMNYLKVLLAVYWFADDEGLFSQATNRELAAHTGLAAESVKHYLYSLQCDRVIAWAAKRHHPSRRTLVLLDHPHADDHITDRARSEPWERHWNQVEQP